MTNLVLAAGAPTPSFAPWKNNAVLAGFIGFATVVVLPVVDPTAAIVFGVLATASFAAFVGSPKVRAWVDRVPAASRISRFRRYVAAVGVGGVGVCSACLGIATHRAEAEQVALHAEVSEHLAERAAQKQVELEEGMMAFDDAMSHGKLGTARTVLDAAIELDSGHPGVVERAQELKVAVRDQELARLPGLIESIRRASAESEWSAAVEICSEAETIDNHHVGLKTACDVARDGHLQAQFPRFIEAALRVVADDSKCGSPLEIQTAWEDLRRIPAEHESFGAAKKASVGLERCRRATQRWLVGGTHDVMQSQRESWARSYETSLLDEGIDVRVSLGGKRKTRLKIKYVLLNRAGVHQITKDGTFLTNLEKIGFARVTFSDGFYDSWYYDLAPDDVEHEVLEGTLKPMGLDKRLEM